MTTQVISFRASGNFLEQLQAQQLDGESVNQTAQRLLKELLGETSPDPTEKTVSTLPSTGVNNQKTVQTRDDFGDIAKGYYAQAMDQMNAAIAQIREELLGELHA